MLGFTTLHDTRRYAIPQCLGPSHTPRPTHKGTPVGRSDRGVLAITERGKPWKARNRDPWIQASQEFFSTLLAAGWRHLAPSCSVHGQDGPLPRRATVSPAPPPPHATRSESMAPQIMRKGPPSSNGRIRPAGGSGKGPSHKIGYDSLLLR